MKNRSLTPTHWHRYEGKSVLVFDGTLSADFVDAFGGMMLSLDYKPRRSFDKELSAPMELDYFERLPELPETIEAIRRRYYRRASEQRSPQRVTGIYCAAVRYGDQTQTHHDIGCPDCMTFLYYGNQYWDSAWGGETIFFDDTRDAMFSVTPKPGRLVFFNAALQHRTGIPMRDCPSFRYGMSIFMRCKTQLEREHPRHAAP